ncbi:MAG TPA: ATP-binding protein [Candidatus Paceibacterota bacterium]|nr:ATP-binding protein [Candidatus Paceibacterota bacterium]
MTKYFNKGENLISKEEIFNNKWFINHLKDIKNKAGARYTPELNINLPISEIFDGISRTESFYTTIREKYGELLHNFGHISSKYKKSELQKNYDQIKENIEALFDILESIKEYNTNYISWNKIQEQTKLLKDKLWEFIDRLRKEKEQVKNIKTLPKKDDSYQPSLTESLESDIYYIYKTQEIIRYFEELSLSSKAKLSNHPFLLLTGLAGTGKTYLLCDVVEQRIKNEKDVLPALLVFGEFFSAKKDFWSQVLIQLGIENTIKTKEDFLKKLDNLGDVAKCRSLFIIDALNENITHAPNFWKNNLNSIIQDINKYPNIALIVSVRSEFENEVLTKNQRTLFVEEKHNGFLFREWEAVNKFFKAFSLPLPEIPLLMTEFQNPLFLLLFCAAFGNKDKNLKNKRKKEIEKIKPFRGLVGSTYIFESFVKEMADKIANDFNIPKGRSQNGQYVIWDTIIKEVASEMVSRNDERIPEEKLNEIIQKIYPQVDVGKFSQALENNMLIVKVPRYEKGKRANGFDFRFPFQKFSDHLIGRYIFKKYEDEFGKSNKNLETAKKFFSKRRKLGKFLSKILNRGIIEALSIQCPEQLNGIEFIEVAPYLIKNNSLAQIAEETFVESIIWRNPKAFSVNNKNTIKIINQYIIKTESGYNQLLNAFLSVAPIPNHPFNAQFLHQYLSKFSMPKRDSCWSTFLHYQYGKQGAVDRLLYWSWSDQDKSHISDESIFLTSIALSWVLTTPNRFVRDKATKGLVCLLENRIHLIPKLLEKFKDVNDPYIIERLFAVAYGCVLRNQNDTKNLKVLAEWIYENIFKDNKPPIHILLRDYARGVIEVALRRGIKLKINVNNINPPYKSRWPKKIPSEEELKKKYYPKNFFKDKTKDRGFLDIWLSVLGGGDFDRYVIGTNSWSCAWSGRKLASSEPNRKKLLEKFKEKLSTKQKELLEKTTNPPSGIDFEEKKKQQKAFIEFEKSLQEVKRSYFKKEIKPFLDGHGGVNDPLENFDLKIAQRWIFNRVVELGYDPKLHGEFDKFINYNRTDRAAHKAERIGKKYQWIAYHEFMALVSDHFEFKGDSWSNLEEDYKGPWNPYVRDIDPSFIIQNDSHIKQSATFSHWKSKNAHYDAWEKEKSNVDWIKTNDDLPNPKNIIQIIDDNKNEWLMLKGFVKWEERTPPEYKKYDIPVREIWYILKSYIVKKKDTKIFFEWAKKQDFTGKWMPESCDFYEIFLGEYPNSCAFDDLRDDYNIWTKSGKGNDDLPVSLVVADDSYLNEFTLDCSYDESVLVKLPCKWLVNKMGLHHKYLDGRFFDKDENLITLVTNIFEKNFPLALLIDKQALINFLDNNGYAIFWILSGEKQLIGGSFSRKDFIGRLEINGTYTLTNRGKIIGESYCNFKK